MQTTARTAAECIQQRHQQRHKVLLVIDNQVVLTQNHPDTGPVEPIIASLLLDPHISVAFIAGVRLFDVLAPLNTAWRDTVPGFSMRITNRDRKVYKHDYEAAMRGQYFVDYITIKSDRIKKRERAKRLVPINLELFADKCNLPKTPEEQMEMTLALLDMCDARGIAFRSTRGSMASAMLKKSRQWVKGRKPAPRFINDKTRKVLPGNFYSVSEKALRGSMKSIPHCYYLDQQNAHHSIASTIPLPHPEFVHARGFYRSGEGRWAGVDSDVGQQLMNGEQIGAVLCKVYISYKVPSRSHLYPAWAEKRGAYNQWIWTPELRLFKDDPRLDLGHFVAAFTASRFDPVLREYSEWALAEISRDQGRATYKKCTLLAAYGMLAYKNQGRPIYRFWSGRGNDNQVEIPIAGLVKQRSIRVPKEYQLSIVNVLARGLIEAETATRTLEYAKELHQQGFHIPQLYADGLLVETERLPFLAPGWRNLGSRTNVYIPWKNAFVSDQEKKLPGVLGGPEEKEWERILEEALRPIALSPHRSASQKARIPT